jgi:NTE family protein
LALSGGGFRAAFFHLGVLARLAELGLLRQVEVISTVSGGSIIGALYYLRVKDLLDNVSDGEVTDDHYVEIVARIEQEFLTGVERHVRGRAYANIVKNVKMARANYSRSDRIGELYDETFYRPAWEHPIHGTPRSRDRQLIEMRELLIAPPGADGEFKPLRDNGERQARVPILLLNATSLNSGHNWRFEAVGMGEDPRSSGDWVQIDKNMRLATGRYDQIAPHQSSFELGLAVAASACVPTLFHPLAVSDLFASTGGGSSNVRVQLVDGGVHDNQGVSGLIDTGCRRMIVSDASGQMRDDNDPSTRIPAVGGRATNIYGDRVREEELIGVVKTPPIALMHLRKGLPARVFAPLGQTGPISPSAKLGTIGYDVDPRVKERLALVRTDLDSFTQVEAASLARFGYLMTGAEVGGTAGIRELTRAEPLSTRWVFDANPRLAEQMARPTATYIHHLEVAEKRFFKGFALSRTARVGGIVALVATVGLLGWGIYAARDAFTQPVPMWSALAAAAVGAVFVGLYLKTHLRLPGAQKVADFLYGSASPALLAPFFFVAAWTMLLLNPVFLRAGRLERALRR